MPTTPTKERSVSRLAWGILLTILLLAAPAIAQDPVVNSAEPSSAEQETLDLVVMVGGANFGADSEVEFFVTGTADTGGIHVKKVKRQGPKTLKVTIDVAPDAQTLLDFDIQVRSRGRSGKGIELFKVIEKTHPNQDTTPPDAPIDLHVTGETFNTVNLVWTMPGDDGDGINPPSGRVYRCSCSEDGQSFSSSACGICLGDPGTSEQPWPDPGEQQTCIPTNLEEDTTYSYWVKCTDEAGNWSSPSDVVAATRPFSDFRDSSWTIEEVTIDGAPVQFDAAAGHGYISPTEVLIAGTVVLWNQNEGPKKWPVYPRFTRFVTGTWDGATWSWRLGEYEDLPGFVGVLHTDPLGNPVLEGTILRDARTQTHDLVYAYHDGSGWRTEVVATEAGPSRYRPGLRWERGFAFDPAGNPAIAWCADDGDGGPRLARRVGDNQWITEEISQEACYTGSAGLAFAESVGRWAVSYVLYRDWPAPYETKVAIRSDQGWVEEEICRGPDFPYQTGCSGIPWLAYDPAAGLLSAAIVPGDIWNLWFQACDREGANNWQCTPQVVGSFPEPGILGFRWSRFLELDSQGEMFVAHVAAFGPGFALSRRLSGQSTWTQEYVDYSGAMPSLALDFSGQLPTLTWVGNLGGEPASEYHLYFAWK